jgi:hypothetical protein
MGTLYYGDNLDIILVGLVFQEFRVRRYHCPDCGALLPHTPSAPEARLEYFCPHCDVIWGLA